MFVSIPNKTNTHTHTHAKPYHSSWIHSWFQSVRPVPTSTVLNDAGTWCQAHRAFNACRCRSNTFSPYSAVQYELVPWRRTFGPPTFNKVSWFAGCPMDILSRHGSCTFTNSAARVQSPLKFNLFVRFGWGVLSAAKIRLSMDRRRTIRVSMSAGLATHRKMSRSSTRISGGTLDLILTNSKPVGACSSDVKIVMRKLKLCRGSYEFQRLSKNDVRSYGTRQDRHVKHTS